MYSHEKLILVSAFSVLKSALLTHTECYSGGLVVVVVEYKNDMNLNRSKMHIDRIIGASGVGVAVPFPITTQQHHTAPSNPPG